MCQNQEKSGIQDLEDPGSGILTDPRFGSLTDPRSFVGICRRIQWIWIISTDSFCGILWILDLV